MKPTFFKHKYHTALAALLFCVNLEGCTSDNEGGTDGVGGDPGDGGGAVACDTDGQCDDGVFCNGEESCAAGFCQAGKRVDCDDSIECTVDRCDEEGQTCTHEAPDLDGDGFVAADCLDAKGVPLGTDCDDTDPDRFPGNVEVCDFEAHDEDCDPTTFGFLDEDEDGAVNDRCCNEAADGELFCGDDCDDENPARHPEHPEICDDLDNDCDGQVDENTKEVPWYLDEDGDNYGAIGSTGVLSCAPIAGRAINATDCDDTAAAVHPAAVETCDDVDNNCDGLVDEGGVCECGPEGDAQPCACDGTSSGIQICEGGAWAECVCAECTDGARDCAASLRLLCADGQWQSVEECDGNNNACVDGACVCQNDTYRDQPGGDCVPCTEECASGLYATGACTPEENLECSACELCEDGSFETVACTTATNRECTVCTAIEHCTALSCTNETDSTCSSCSGGRSPSPDGSRCALWSQQAYLKAPNVGARDWFGSSVSVSGDTIVVGAPHERSNQSTITNGGTASPDDSFAAAGAAYVFFRSGSNWSQQAYLKAPNVGADDQFGWSVSVSGETIVVGAPTEDSNQSTITNGDSASSDDTSSNSGAAYVFLRSGSNWSQQAYLKAPNVGAGDQFGDSVSVSGETIVVGARLEDSDQSTITNGSSASSINTLGESGAAYVFFRSGSNWSQQAYLKAPNVGASDWFGSSVSVSGDTIVVGAPLERSNQSTITNGSSASSNNTAGDSGAAYVFFRSGSSWSQQAYLKAPNVDAGDEFGNSVSVSGETIVVGAPLERSNQSTITNGSSASSDDTLVAAGAAYVFFRSGSSWSQQAYLKAPNVDAGDFFGTSVSVSAETIVVGAPREDSNQSTITNGSSASSDDTLNAAGAAYVFSRSGSSWSQQAYLKAPNVDSGDLFGTSVSVSGETIVVGAPLERSNQSTITNGSSASPSNVFVDSGAAYVFFR